MRMLYRPALLVLAIGMVASCSNSGSTTPSTTPTPTPNANFAAVHVPSSGGYGPSSFVPWCRHGSCRRQRRLVERRQHQEHHPFANDGSWNADLPAGSDATVTFNTAGTYAYHCSIHPTMTGTITVK